jgi:RNA-binding protein NOB1
LDEIRDEKARESLECLPFELKVMSPSKESLAHVIQFAKTTGDFAALSVTDLKLIALAHMLHASAKSANDFNQEDGKVGCLSLLRQRKY